MLTKKVIIISTLLLLVQFFISACSSPPAPEVVVAPTSEQIECMIDKIMQSPERVGLLGKVGLRGKGMAEKRMQRQSPTDPRKFPR